jgi:hypothetical protein
VGDLGISAHPCAGLAARKARKLLVGQNIVEGAMKFLSDEMVSGLLPATASFPSPVPTQIVNPSAKAECQLRDKSREGGTADFAIPRF